MTTGTDARDEARARIRERLARDGVQTPDSNEDLMEAARSLLNHSLSQRPDPDMTEEDIADIVSEEIKAARSDRNLGRSA